MCAGEQPREAGLGISPHKDSGLLTILAQDAVPGLEVLRQGTWQTVQPLPGAFVVNVGDMAQASCTLSPSAVYRPLKKTLPRAGLCAQVLTNDRFKAVEHRVKASAVGQERYSIAFFLSPSYRCGWGCCCASGPHRSQLRAWVPCSADVAPLPSCVSASQPAAYRCAATCCCLARLSGAAALWSMLAGRSTMGSSGESDMKGTCQVWALTGGLQPQRSMLRVLVPCRPGHRGPDLAVPLVAVRLLLSSGPQCWIRS